MTIFKNWFFANVYEIFVKLFLFANSRDNHIHVKTVSGYTVPNVITFPR